MDEFYLQVRKTVVSYLKNDPALQQMLRDSSENEVCLIEVGKAFNSHTTISIAKYLELTPAVERETLRKHIGLRSQFIKVGLSEDNVLLTFFYSPDEVFLPLGCL